MNIHTKLYTEDLAPLILTIASPQIRNMLLPHLKDTREQFKSDLKSWFFEEAYSGSAVITLLKRHYTNARVA